MPPVVHGRTTTSAPAPTPRIRASAWHAAPYGAGRASLGSNPQGGECANLSHGETATHAKSDTILDRARNVALPAACCTVDGTLCHVLVEVPLLYWLLLRKQHAPTHPRPIRQLMLRTTDF
jgi:hypothetical protein